MQLLNAFLSSFLIAAAVAAGVNEPRANCEQSLCFSTVRFIC